MAHVFDTPDFKNEQEKAEWWDSHEDEIMAAFEEAAKNGTLGRGTLMRDGVVETFKNLANERITLNDSAKHKSAA